MNFFKTSSGPAYLTNTQPAFASVIRSYEQRVEEWSSPPIDDLGYLPSSTLLAMDPHDLHTMIVTMAFSRYEGWRNYENRWRDVLGLDTTHDKRVLDYGCGVGLEAVQYALSGNDVAVADISRDNVRLAQRVLRLFGFDVEAFMITEGLLIPSILVNPYDVIHCCGVLHHIPDPERTINAFWRNLNQGGQVRLMLYSDEAWRIATGTEPPQGPVEEHPLFERYWTHWDPIGGYADWYDLNRLEERFGKGFEVVRYEPLTEHGEYIGAVLEKK